MPRASAVLQAAASRARATLGRRRRDAEWIWALRGVPRSVLVFQWRARQLAWRESELFSFVSATRPVDLRPLLALAEGRRHVVELGTGTGWSAISLALADPERRVVSYDPYDRSPQRFLALVDDHVRDRIEFIVADGAAGPRSDEPVDLLYIDSSHEREPTIEEVRTWSPHLRPGAPVVFDDYVHSEFSGVREAVTELGLDGEVRGKLFVHWHRG